MSRDFMAELRNICADKPKPIELYNIYKRGVPFRNYPLNKVVMIGLTRDEADKEIIKLLRKENRRRNEDDMNNIYFFYDIVRMNANEDEKSVFYNEGSPVL